MRSALRLLLVVLSILLVLMMFFATENKYSLIYDIDRSIPVGSLLDQGDNGHLVSGVGLFLLLVIQFVIFLIDKSKTWRVISALFALLSIVIFVLRG